MRKAVLIYNPMSGRQAAARLLPGVLGALRQARFAVEPVATSGPGDATQLASEAAGDPSIQVAFAMGGDGTLREVARGLLGSSIALGPLPTGTTNVLTLALGLPRNALDAARSVSRCTRREIDVGQAGGEPFLMQASGGLDASVMARQNSGSKRRFGKAAIAWTAARQWAAYDYPAFDLRVEGRVEKVSHFAACNIPQYAGSFRIAPGADLGDGLLDLVSFKGKGRLATLAFARDLALGRHLRRPDVDLRQVGKVEILGPGEEILVQLDGDVLSAPAPLEIALARDRLWVLSRRQT